MMFPLKIDENDLRRSFGRNLRQEKRSDKPKQRLFRRCFQTVAHSTRYRSVYREGAIPCVALLRGIEPVGSPNSI
jgi:hypothetical protein